MSRKFFGIVNFDFLKTVLLSLVSLIKSDKRKKAVPGEKGKFSKFVIRKVTILLEIWIDYYMAFPVEQLKLSVSKGNRKIGKVLNVSLAPIITCGNCKECRFYCYDIKACLAYPTALLARARNTAIFLLDRDYFFSELDKELEKRKTNKYLRFHVAGEIVDLDHFCRMVEITRKYPDFKIWTYTKMYSIVNYYCYLYGKDSIPEHFTIEFSEWKGMPIDNPYDFPVFACAFPGEKINGYVCPGNCDICKKNGQGCVNGKSATARLH